MAIYPQPPKRLCASTVELIAAGAYALIANQVKERGCYAPSPVETQQNGRVLCRL
jgi:hypothetical protein